MKGLFKRLSVLAASLAMVFGVDLVNNEKNAKAAGESTYVKVTEAPTDWTGEYVLVYESSATSAYVWTGVDATSCYETTTITDSKISLSPTAKLNIASMTGGYSIKISGGTNNGKYVGQGSNANGMKIQASALANTLSIASNSATIISGGAYMRFNANTDQMRFRYYKSTSYTKQKAVQLYKLDESSIDPNESKITLDLSSSMMKVETTLTLNAETSGTGTTITWESSDINVATVADGVVTALKAGTTTITATFGTASASCKILVNPEHSGTSANDPLTIAEAKAAIAGNGLASTEKYYIKGIIAAYTPNSSDVSTYGNISFDISDDGTTTKVFKAFQVNYLNGDKFTSADQVAKGDTVVLYGAVMNYNNATPETAGKGAAYVYAHTPKVTRTLESLSLTGTLTKTEYTTDDTFSPKGLTITANYSDETTEDVTNDVTWPALTAGMTSITGTYEDKTIEVTGITVTEAVVTYTLSIKLDVETVYADTDGKLTYELKDNKGNAFSGNITSVAWSSSNTTALEIGQTSGEYLAYEAGKTTIELWVYTDNTSVYFNTTLELEVKNAPTYVVDKLTANDFTATSTAYTNFKDVTSTSGIKYAGQSANNSSNIQLRSKNNNSGIVSTTAKRILTKVEAEWSSTTTGTLDVYGYNTAFNDATELYNTKAVKLGSLTSASPSLEIPTDAKYAYVGVRSNSGAVIIASISFTWDVSKDANDFIDMWNKMRADGTNGICDYLNGTQDSSELDTLLEMYNTMLDDADKAIVNDAADGENNTIGNSILYIAAYKAAHTSNNAGMNNAYHAVTNNISFILIISVIGLSSVLGYYFIQKRRLVK